MNKTYIPKNIKNQNSRWYIIDAKDKNLGRLSSKIASVLKGKTEIDYTPYINSMNYIVVINATHINVTGKKQSQKIYRRHSGRPGGLKIRSFKEVYNKFPTRIIEKSIKGMLPKNTLGRQLFRQLKVYSDSDHPHNAQKPQIISFT